MANTCHVGMGYIYENISEHHIIGDYVPNECFPIQMMAHALKPSALRLQDAQYSLHEG